jgi:quinone-modifying oxidoreductase subunit QmoA
MSDIVATNQTILVVGGGISGMTAALEAAEVGKQVIVIEKTPSVGGRVTKL